MTDEDCRHRNWWEENRLKGFAGAGRLAEMSPEEIAAIEEYIIANEGWHQRAYSDSLGIPTVGVGFNLLRDDAPTKLRALGLDCDAVRLGRLALSDEQVGALLALDLEKAMAGVAALVPGWSALAPARRKALVDMAFNLGVGGLAKFSRLLAAVNREDWQSAEAEIVDSLYYRQVGTRARRNADAIRHGT